MNNNWINTFRIQQSKLNRRKEPQALFWSESVVEFNEFSHRRNNILPWNHTVLDFAFTESARLRYPVHFPQKDNFSGGVGVVSCMWVKE